MAEIKKTEATVKPVATIKTGTVATEAKKVETKVVAATAPKTEAKKEVKAETKKAPAKKATAAKKPAAKKAPAKKAAPAKKPAAKKTTTAKKPAAKKAAPAKAAALKANLVLQYADKHVTYDTLVQNALNKYQFDMGGDVNAVKSINLYVKPQDNKVYFVVNDKIASDYDL